MKKWLLVWIIIGFVCGVSVAYLLHTHYLRMQSDAAYANGLSLVQANETDKAAAVFNQAIGLNSKNYRPYVSLGRIYEEKHLVNLSVEHYKKALILCDGGSALEIADRKYVEERLSILQNHSCGSK